MASKSHLRLLGLDCRRWCRRQYRCRGVRHEEKSRNTQRVYEPEPESVAHKKGSLAIRMEQFELWGSVPEIVGVFEFAQRGSAHVHQLLVSDLKHEKGTGD